MPSVKPSFPRLRRDGHWSVRDLVAHYPFYEGAGDILHDIAGNNDGTLTGMDPPTDWVSGEVGTCLDFAGDNDYVLCGATPHYPEFTCVALLRRATAGAAAESIAAHHGQGTMNPSDWYWRFEADDTMHVDIPWVANDVYVGIQTIADTNWHTCAMVRSGTAGAWTYTGYIDGVLDDADAAVANPQTTVFEFMIASVSVGTHYFTGEIGSVSLYSRALCTAEVGGLSAFPNIVYEPEGMPWLGAGAAGGVTVTPSVAAITASMPGEVATGGALIAASVADVLSEAIAAQALGAAQISASVADMASSLPAGAATGGAKIAPSVLSLLAELPTETIISGAVVAVDPVTATITLLGVILRTGEVMPPLHVSNLQRQFIRVVNLRRQQVRVGDLRRGNIHADLD